MEIHVFAESSNTTGDPKSPLEEYYQGLFGMVAGLTEELSAFGDTELHVLSERYGIATSDRIFSDLEVEHPEPVGFDEMVTQTRDTLVDTAATADVMVLLLSTDVFEATVREEWVSLVDAAKPASIWCLSAARSALGNIDQDALREKDCIVLTYQRRGVARIGTETREKLLEHVKKEAK